MQWNPNALRQVFNRIDEFKLNKINDDKTKKIFATKITN